MSSRVFMILLLSSMLGVIDARSQAYVQSYAVVSIDSCRGMILIDRPLLKELKHNSLILLHVSQATSNDIDSSCGRTALCTIDTTDRQRIFVVNDLSTFTCANTRIQLVVPATHADMLNGIHDTLRCMPWNGACGGIIAIIDTVVDLRGMVIDASGCGFQGGRQRFPTSDTNVAPTPAQDGADGQDHSFKQAAVAGKAGAAHNGGGSGGSAYQSGGRGGGTSSAFQPVHAGSAARDGNSTTRFVFGAGGGSGHRNDLSFSDGGRGGGIIIVIGDTILMDETTTLRVDGADGCSTVADGAGGGGAAGSIALVGQTIEATGTLSLCGGNGGNIRCASIIAGPGGGGAGGTLLTEQNSVLGSVLLNGGSAGVATVQHGAPSQHGAEQGLQGNQHVDIRILESLPKMLPPGIFLRAADTIVPYGATTTIMVTGAGTVRWDDRTVVPRANDEHTVETPAITHHRWFACTITTPRGCLVRDSIRVRPKTEAVSLTVEVDYLRAKPGDTTDLFMRMVLSSPLQRNLQGIATISAYAGVAIPLRSTNRRDNRIVCQVPFTISAGALSTFRRERLAVVLGDSAVSQILIDSVEIIGSAISVRRKHGRLTLDSICLAGGRPRLFDPHAAQLRIEGRRISASADQMHITDLLGRDVGAVVSYYADTIIAQIPEHVRGLIIVQIEQPGYVTTRTLWFD